MKPLYLKYPVSLGMCVLCVCVFVFGFILPITDLYEALSYSSSIARMRAEPYRFFTPMLLHFHWIHIGFNLAIWWFFAKQLEEKWGSSALIAVTLFMTLASNVAQFFASGPNFGGLSGVVFGLVGCAWGVNLLLRRNYFWVPAGLMIQILMLLALGFSGLLDFIIGPIANMAHLIGLLSGMVVGGVFFIARWCFKPNR